MPKKLTNEEFLAKARERHGDKYEYLSPYTNTKALIAIRCKKHDYVFHSTPINHIYGKCTGCPICASESRKDKLRLPRAEVISKAENIHGKGRYDYSRVGDFANTAEIVTIICHDKDDNGVEHGAFRQSFRNHIYNRQGCPRCAGLLPLTNESFKSKAQKIHGLDKFDYSLVDYKNNKTKVEIICNDCGFHFFQEPSNHLMGQGCPECAKSRLGDATRLTKEQFVLKARQVHGDKYDYSKVEYKNSCTKVCIICPIHGEFWMTPNSHLQGQGCPKCKGDASKKIVYGVGINDTFGKERDVIIYGRWRSMLKRCYDKKDNSKHPTYANCTVCDEWLIFSNYQKWYKENCYKDFAVDKDILLKGNKIYSPETCCFVPQEINNLLLRSQKARGKYPIGVFKSCNNTFFARVSKVRNGVFNRTEIGYFNTPEEAFQAYKQAKESYIKEVAQEYYDRDEITKKVYDALMRYEVEITD